MLEHNNFVNIVIVEFVLFQTARNIDTKLCSSFIGSRVCDQWEEESSAGIDLMS